MIKFGINIHAFKMNYRVVKDSYSSVQLHFPKFV